MELKEMLKKLSGAVCDLRLKGSKNNPLITEVNKLLVKDSHSRLLNAYNSFYVKDEETEYASVKYSGVRYIVIKTKNDIGEDIAVYAFDREGLNSNPLVPKYIATNGISYDIHDCDNECINTIMDYVITFLNNLTDADLSKTNIKPDICTTIHNIMNYIVIAKTEDFNQFIFDEDESNNIFAADKRFDDALEEANKSEVTKEDIKKLADELADNLMNAVKKDNDNATEEVKSNSISIKEVEEEHTAPVDVFEEPVPIFDHERNVKKMTEKVKTKNLKKEFWDEKLVFPIKNKKFFELLNRIYDDLRKKIVSGHYALSTNDGGETFNWEKMDNFGEYIGFLFNDNMNVSIYADKSDASKYLKMDVYQTSKDLNIAANLFTVYFNLSNKYFYYEGRGYEAQFNFLSTIMHPALIFFYSDTQIMSNLFRIIFHEYGFDNVMDNAEEVYKKQKIADKARKAIKKEEERRKKAEKKKEKKAAKKEKESKEEKK